MKWHVIKESSNRFSIAYSEWDVEADSAWEAADKAVATPEEHEELAAELGRTPQLLDFVFGERTDFSPSTNTLVVKGDEQVWIVAPDRAQAALRLLDRLKQLGG